MSIDLTQIIIAILGVIVSIISLMIIPRIKLKLTTEQQENLAYWIDIAVMAAEGIFTQTGMGAAKYQYVIDFLEKKGFKIKEDEIKALVESSVYQLINQFKEVDTNDAG